MNMTLAAHPQRLARLALLVALVAVLRFAALDLHHALVEHDGGEHCELCLVVERGGHAVPVAPTPTLSLSREATPVPPRPVPAQAALAWRPLPRGPPVRIT